MVEYYIIYIYHMFIYLFNHICICRYMYIEYVTLNIIYIYVTLISWWWYRHNIYVYMCFFIFYFLCSFVHVWVHHMLTSTYTQMDQGLSQLIRNHLREMTRLKMSHEKRGNNGPTKWIIPFIWKTQIAAFMNNHAFFCSMIHEYCQVGDIG